MDHLHTYMPFMRTSSLDFLENSNVFNVRQQLSYRTKKPIFTKRGDNTLNKETSLPSVRTRGQVDAFTFFNWIRLTPQLLMKVLFDFEIEMYIIFLPGSNSLTTLNLALTIYND